MRCLVITELLTTVCLQVLSTFSCICEGACNILDNVISAFEAVDEKQQETEHTLINTATSVAANS